MKNTIIATAVCAWAGLLSLNQTSDAQEWTRFRGPNGTGISNAETIPVRWTEADFNWKVAIPGAGHSHPVFWGEKIFLTTALGDGDARVVLCLSVKDGRTLWHKEIPSTSHNKHKFNSFASATPAVDKDRVYVAFSVPESYTLSALDHDGEIQWTADLGPFVSQHSCGTSPIVAGDMVVLGNEQDGVSSMVAVDRNTGKIRWETPRRTEKVAYATPMIYQPKGEKPQLVSASWAHGIYALDLATGAPIWEAPLFDKRVCASPVFTDGVFVASCGSGGGGMYLVAVRPGGEGDVSSSHLAYKITRSMPYVPTAVTKDNLLFLWSDGGIVSCVKGATGDVVWQKRVDASTRFFGSPIRVRDRIYNMSADGECVVIAASEQFQVLTRNPLGEGTHSTPAVSGGRLYLRTFGHLISIGGKTGP